MPIVLSVQSGARTAPEKLLAGEVTAIEAEFSPAGSFTVVRGFDQAHRLFRGRVSESYRNVTYSDVARLVARRAALPVGRIDDSRTVHPHVAQGNESDWQFLSRLAAEIGFEVAVVEGKLDFRTPTQSEEAPEAGDHTTVDPLALVPGTSLLRFRSTVTSAEQVKEVVVRGWDVANKQVVVGRAPAGTTSAQLGVDPVRSGREVRFARPQPGGAVRRPGRGRRAGQGRGRPDRRRLRRVRGCGPGRPKAAGGEGGQPRVWPATRSTGATR